MTPLAAGWTGIAVLVILICMRMRIGIAMALVGFLGFGYLMGIRPAIGLLKLVPYDTFHSSDLSVIPLFILMGTIAFTAGLSVNLYAAAYAWLGGLRGGLAMATVGACAMFAAISGSSLATAATLCKVALPEMRKYRYEDGFAAASIAAGGVIGILIPPSVILLIYGIITETSIGQLFVAGIIPGILEAAVFMVAISIVCRFRPEAGPRGARVSFRDKLLGTMKIKEALILFTVMIGGMYAGFFTVTEAAAMGAFVAIFFGIVKRTLKWGGIKSSLLETMESSGMVFLIIMGAMIFGYFLSVAGIPASLANFAAGLNINRYLIMLVICFIILALGSLMDSMAIVLITTPIFFPLVMQLGFHPVWFGVIVTKMTELGLMTPPVGLNVYIIKGLSGVPMERIFANILPFVIADVILVGALIAFPQLSLFLPGLMAGM